MGEYPGWDIAVSPTERVSHTAGDSLRGVAAVGWVVRLYGKGIPLFISFLSGRRTGEAATKNITGPCPALTVTWSCWRDRQALRFRSPRIRSVIHSPRSWRNKMYRSRLSVSCWGISLLRQHRSIWRASRWSVCRRWTGIVLRACVNRYPKWGRRLATWEVAYSFTAQM